MDREGGQGGSALAIQISQAGWTDVINQSINLSIYLSHFRSLLDQQCWSGAPRLATSTYL